MAINVILMARPEPESRWKTLEPLTKTCGGQVLLRQDKTAQTYWRGTHVLGGIKPNSIDL